MSTTEAADLARTILADSEDEHPTAMYVLSVREARTLARAVIELTEKVERMEALVDRLFDAEADPMVSRGGVFISRAGAANLIRAALKGDTA